jgi:hypothetical protein
MSSCQENETSNEVTKEKKSTPILTGETIKLNNFSAFVSDTAEVINRKVLEDNIVYYKAEISCALSNHILDSSYRSNELSEELVNNYINRIAEKQMCRLAKEVVLEDNYFFGHLTCDEYEILMRGTIHKQQIMLASSKCKKDRVEEAKAFVLSLKQD